MPANRMLYEHVSYEPAGPAHTRLVLYSNDSPDRVECVLSVAEVHSLIGNLLNALEPKSLTREVLTGNCATCQNTRLVGTQRVHGQPWTVQCPDCSGVDTSPKVQPLRPYFAVKPDEATG